MIKNIVIFFLLVIIIMLLILLKYKARKREKIIDNIIRYLMAVQDNPSLPKIETMSEGSYGILQSEIYKVVELLREAYSKEASDKKYMADMLSDISHQIKTPVSAISIMADLLSSPEVSDEQRIEYADKIEKQARHITVLIKNLLNLARLEADVTEFKKDRVKISDIFDSVRESLEIMAEVKGVELTFEDIREETLECDRYWMTEALNNIVKNCIEHTDTGGSVDISADKDNIATCIKITDGGQGISEHDLTHIFDRFYKANAISSDSYGIGLAISKQIILKQNGIITVKSVEGVGSEFYIKMFEHDTL